MADISLTLFTSIIYTLLLQVNNQAHRSKRTQYDKYNMINKKTVWEI